MPKRRCSGVGCPRLIYAGKRYCAEHQREYDERRGSPKARGYDAPYHRARARAKRLVDSGRAVCWRCGKPIAKGAPFDLGHDDHDRSIIRGPEHPQCNRSAAGKSAHQSK